jgi:hypothetical protein
MVAARTANLPPHRPPQEKKSANLRTSQSNATTSSVAAFSAICSCRLGKGTPELQNDVYKGAVPVEIEERAGWSQQLRTRPNIGRDPHGVIP